MEKPIINIEEIAPDSFIVYFQDIEDPRINRKKLHPLINIIAIALCAILCGADTWVEVERYGKTKIDFLRKHLNLPHGIPSHDTFGRVFSILNPILFERCFLAWMADVLELNEETIIALDGKTVRGSHDQASGKRAIHMVSAYASEAGLILGQVKTSAKSNEITAIPELLDTLEIKGYTITIDAMGCQKDIASKIKSKKAEYILALKGNQGNLQKDVDDYFEYAQDINFKNIPHSFAETLEKGHGRIERRRCWVVEKTDWLKDLGHNWEGLNSIVLIESSRTIKGVESVEKRTYISSRQGNAEAMMRDIRNHWGIENKLHWCLDVSFREDESRVRKDHAPQNFSVLRRISMNIVKMDQSKNKKSSIRVKRKMAGWDDNYLAHLVFGEQYA